MTIPDLALDPRAVRLRDALGARILLPGDDGFDAARMPWNVAFDQRPIAVARPETAEDVVDVVRAAVAAGLRIAPQATGHAAGALAGTALGDVVLVSLAGLRGAVVDPVARTARVLGGSQWNDVLEAAAPHGLTALHGSAGDVGVVGYSLSGGLSFYARAHGLAINSVRAVQVVLADGALVRASRDEHPDLFWALRGGSGAFGIVVSIELDLLAQPEVFAGMLLWDASRAAEVSAAWAAFTRAAPESATTTLRILHFPPMPDLPPFLSGRDLVVVDGAILESDEGAATLLEPLRALGPEVDTFAPMPAAALVQVHLDPPGPTPALTAHVVLGGLPDDAVSKFVEIGTAPGLFITELRHLGGAIRRPALDGGAVTAIDGEYLAHTIAVVPVPEAAVQAAAAVQAGIAAFSPWRVDALALTFVDGPLVDRSHGFGTALGRLREIKAAVDPDGVFVAAHPV
ncbi:FAD-dependent oxidoreductase [Agromyces seonyuensis]|uniref:FAD-binding protein n=1 Tax=Agromyces seonyuensis TaxID=2662446 RepID=A0A6I4NWL1_9MICO|nr:FAD-binding protein [Agromyces seonyuensis]MWB97472.1 FAD-binding protein [Agromyces seonyuensis]